MANIAMTHVGFLLVLKSSTLDDLELL